METQTVNMKKTAAYTGVTFVGAGPGAEDLITLRGLRYIQEADMVLYAGSLVHPVHLQACKETCQHFDTAAMNLEEQVNLMTQAVKAGKHVVRLHTGDPAMFGAINEQIKGLREQGVMSQVVPGVSSVFAAAAALGCELTCPEVSQTVVLTRTPGRTPMPEKEDIRVFAKTGATLVFFLSVGKIDTLMQKLMREGDVSPDTPAALVYRVTWPEERLIRGTVSTLAQKCTEAGIGRQALILVGKALAQHDTASLLYDASFSHGYRNNLPTEHFDGACAVYAFSAKGLARAQEIASGLALPATIYSTFEQGTAQDTLREKPQKALQQVPTHVLTVQDFDRALQQQWGHYAAHIFVNDVSQAACMAMPLLQKYAESPAVLACSESGAHCVCLSSADAAVNRLCRRVARITGGQAVLNQHVTEEGDSPWQHNSVEQSENVKATSPSREECLPPEPAQKRVLVVGLGSGAAQHITPQVDAALRSCDVVAGYTKYVDFIRERIAHKPIIQNGMMGEVQRCTDALAEAATGKSVCMVCSGDPGILAMAGLLFELKARNEAFEDVCIEVLPGITAANIAAASLGAPLQNGFSLVSLSDLLVPAHEVRQNLVAVAQSALPVVLYNPAGKKRRELLQEALAIFKKYRGETLLCAYVRHAGRPQEEKWIGTLRDFPEQEVDMSTLVLIGSARTVFKHKALYEARGYAEKYLK